MSRSLNVAKHSVGMHTLFKYGMCFDQLSLLVIHMPRSRSFSVFSIAVSSFAHFNLYVKLIGWCFLVICIDLHLEVFSCRPALEEEVWKFKRSLWSWVASVTELISLKSFVSSTNIAMFEWVTAEVRSFSYSKKSIGPRMDP